MLESQLQIQAIAIGNYSACFCDLENPTNTLVSVFKLCAMLSDITLHSHAVTPQPIKDVVCLSITDAYWFLLDTYPLFKIANKFIDAPGNEMPVAATNETPVVATSVMPVEQTNETPVDEPLP